MRNLKAFIAVLFLVTLGAGAAATAAEKTAGGPDAAGAREVAAFSVPRLKGAVLKDLAKALADEPGIVRAKADRKSKTFLVTFDGRRTSPEAILRAVNTVSKEATLVAVTPADPKAAGGPGCGGCPQAKSCPGSKK